MIGPGEDIGVGRVDSYVLPCLQEELQAGLTVRREDEGLDPSTFTLDPNSGEVRKHQALKWGQRGFQWGKSWGGPGWDRNGALGSDASTIFSDGQLGDLTLTSSVVQDEESQAGVTKKAPGFG